MDNTPAVPMSLQLTDEQFKSLFGVYLANLEKKIDALHGGRNPANPAVAIQNKFPERDLNFVGVVNSCPRNNVNLSDMKFDTVSKTYRRPIALEDMTKAQLEEEIAKIDKALSKKMDADSKKAYDKILNDQRQVYADRLRNL
jgi:hypothetical protein